jgi:uncharacterized protein (DUF433 family)
MKSSGIPIVLVPHPHVRIDSMVLSGSPYVIGSRVPVRRILVLWRSTGSVDRVMKRYPQLGAAKIFDALAFALDNLEVIEADIAREAKLVEGAQ